MTRPEYLRRPDRADVDAFYPVLAVSLFLPPDPGGWIDDEGPERFRLVVRGGEVLGGMSVQRMGQWFGGRSLHCGAVRCVAVRPDVRASGVGGLLIRESLAEMRQDGVPLACLYPATQKLYQKAGYELAGSEVDWLLDLHRVEVRDRTAAIRAGSEDDLPILRELHGRRARTASGMLDRDEWGWRKILYDAYEHRARSIWIVEGDSGPEGYAVTQTQGSWQTPPVRLLVKDHVALTAAASLRLLSFLGDHRSVVHQAVVSAGPSLPLLQLLPQPTWWPPLQFVSWMLRVVDLRAALEGRGFAPGREGRLDLQVDDDVLPENAGRWTVGVAGGRCEVRRGGTGSLRIGARGLAALYSGFSAAEDLRCVGLADGPDEVLARASSLFAGPAPWMPDRF